jgi:hypothetical protein
MGAGGSSYAGKKRPRQAELTAWRLKMIIFRDGPKCWLCHESCKVEDRTIDHAIPKAHGGKNDLHNLRLAHAICNHKRGAIQSAKAVPQKAAGIRAALALFKPSPPTPLPIPEVMRVRPAPCIYCGVRGDVGCRHSSLAA